MSKSTPPAPADVSNPGSLASRYQTTRQLLSSTSRYSDEWFRLKEEEAALRSDFALEDSRPSGFAGNDAELRISTDFHVDDHNVVDPNKRPTIVPDEGPPVSPLENHFDKNAKLESTVVIGHEDDVAPIPIRQSSSCFVDDEITRKIKIAGHNQLANQALVVEDSNASRTPLNREILEQTNAPFSARGDGNVVHISVPNIRSTSHLATTSQLAPNDAPITPDTADPSRTLSDTPSRSTPYQNDVGSESEEEEEEVFTIPEAFLVRETIDIPLADVVEPVERADHASISSMKRRVCVLTLLVVAFFAIAVGSALYVTLGRGPASSAQPQGTPEPSSALFEPSLEPSYYPLSHSSLMSVQDYIETYVLQRNVTFDGMDSLDPRKKALDWITKTDPLQLNVSDANLQQRYVLALLFYECSEDNDLGWLSNYTECEWLGVTCRYDDIIKLDLGDKNLTGTIPPEIGRLEYLEVLDMSSIALSSISSNTLSGTLPPELGNLSNLVEIRLQYNDKLSGSIPPEIGRLQLLSTIDLGFNSFTGTLPSELGNASALTGILMARNKITGPLPTEIGKLSRLEVINFAENDISGTIPRELGNFNRLTQMYLGWNSFSGSLPSEIGRLRSLEVLDLNSNSVVGTLPRELGQLKKLTKIYVYNNSLTGTLPTELGNLTALTYLSLGMNQFTGTLPSWLGNLKVESLDLSRNRFNGSLPTEIGLMSELAVSWFFSNALTGTLPPELGNLSNLTELIIFDNAVKGTLPSELGNLAKLTKLELSINNFTGGLPSDIGNVNNLIELYVHANQFTGPLPPEIGRLQNLQILQAGSNCLNGTLPSELGNLKGLHHLWLDNNCFTGTLPTELKELQSLTQLLLNGNQFTGPYLSGLKNCTAGMSILCVKSNNNFTGDLPDECDEVGLNCLD